MIRTNNMGIEVSATKTQLLSELAGIVKTLHKEGKIKKNELEYSFKLAFMTDEELDEIDKKLDKELERNKAKLKRCLEELFGGNKIDI